MNASGERTRSIWMDTEVCLGRRCWTAILPSTLSSWALASRGFPPRTNWPWRGEAVLDRGPIAGGITARRTAHLTSLCDESFKNLIDVQGLDAAKQFYESQAASIARIEKIQNLESIDCDFRLLEASCSRR
jgi:glycine/D-amino acid oxidase-like deaminating enzyme